MDHFQKCEKIMYIMKSKINRYQGIYNSSPKFHYLTFAYSVGDQANYAPSSLY